MLGETDKERQIRLEGYEKERVRNYNVRKELLKKHKTDFVTSTGPSLTVAATNRVKRAVNDELLRAGYKSLKPTLLSGSAGIAYMPKRSSAKSVVDKVIRKYKKRHAAWSGRITKQAFRNLPSEFKFIDVVWSLFNPVAVNPDVANNCLRLLNGVQLGTSASERIGRKAHFKKIQLKVTVVPRDSITIKNFAYRMMVFCDKQPNGAEPTVFSGLLTNYGGETNMNRLNNLLNSGRFVKFYDKVFRMGQTAAALALNGNDSKLNCHNINLKCSEVTTYSGTGATIASISTCAIWFAIFQEVGGASLDVTATTRVRYNDD